MYKKVYSERLVVSIYIFVMVLAFSGCGSTKQLTSTWQNHEIKIDGDPTEWNSTLFPIPDKKTFIGFKNDDKFLYLCLETNDRSIIFQMFRAGFITWFEPVNGDYKPFGISFPQPNIFPDQQQFNANNQDANRENPLREENQDNFMNKMLIQQNQLEIVNKDKYPLMELPLINKEGIEAKLNVKNNFLVYELKIPLAVGNEYSYTAGVTAGNSIKVRFETEKMETAGKESSGQGERTPDSDPGQYPRGAGGSMRRGGGGMRSGGRSGGRGINNSEPFNYTVELKLENAPAMK